MKMLRKLRARINKAPFFLRGFWPYYYSCMNKGKYDDNLSIMFDGFPANVGDVIPLLQGGGQTHSYRVVNRWRMQGGDWGGVSNVKYDFEYHSTEAPGQ